MLPEDRLDALLSARAEAQQQRIGTPLDTDVDERDGLQPLLDAADRVAALAYEEPTLAFMAHLEGLFLTRAAYLRERDQSMPLPANGMAPISVNGMPLGNDDPTLPGSTWATATDDATLSDTRPVSRPFAIHRRAIGRRLLWPALAATLLLAIGMTTFTAAALAGPGSPLYGLHTWEQSIRANLTGSAADRMRLHMSNAQGALAALDDAVAHHQTGAAYDDALATFRDEIRAAATSLKSVPPGGERDALSAQLDQLHTQGIAGLHAALAILSWPQRIETTGALAESGEQTLTVTQADMVYAGHGQHLWTITISGSGFQPGAVLLVNGQPAGTVISVTPTKLVAQMSGDDSAPRPGSIGVGNPDNTAAATTSITSHEENDDDATPGAQQTPTDDDHGSDNHGGGSNSGPGSGGSGSSGDDGP
ncbi:MAG TPA: IPT/TIG domain-containing protein [Ktedonobacterales bacterium]|nr:IPT/TIG domain-containing protein [Ktedonobacterales bacterium]